MAASRPAWLDEDIEFRQAAIVQQWQATPLAEIPAIAVWRQAYRAFGIKRTSYRSSVERLVKNALAGRPLPAINAFVDCYNAVSLTHVLPAGADDLDRVSGDLSFRFSRPDDGFLDMGAADTDGKPLPSPPKPGEVVYADAEKVLCRRWNWRQDARSIVTATTRRAVVTLQANGDGDLHAAATDLRSLLQKACGGSTGLVMADASRPVAKLPLSTA